MGSFVTEGFEAFRKGTFGNGGHNLYVSRKGVLQRIHQYDLNHNGYFDLVFANCQNHHESADSYVYSMDGAERISLHGQGSRCGIAVDLTGDGWLDLVVTGFYDMVSPFASTDIYYGSPEGYSEKYHIRIQTPYAEDCCAGHFDDSPRPVLAFAQPVYKQVRLYGQTNLGLEWTSFKDLPIEASLITAADLDGDGYDELIVRRANATETTVYWGGPQGLSLENCAVLPELDPKEILQPEEEKSMQSDMEKKFEAPRLLRKVVWQGRQCFTLSTGKKVLFFSSNKERRLERIFEIEVPMAMDVAVGDLNGDGLEDLAIACRVRNSADLHRQCSFIWLNSPEGFLLKNRIELDTRQACSVEIQDGQVLFGQSSAGHFYSNDALLFTLENGRFQPEPLRFPGEDMRRAYFLRNPDGKRQIFLLNHFSRSCVGFDKTYIYWGGADGYQPERRLEVPGWCAVDSMSADFDDDGWAELLVANNSECSLHLDPGHFIHHFGPNGFEPEKTKVLNTGIGWGCAIGDFDHNGYLDVISVGDHWNTLRLYRGGPDGFKGYETIELDETGEYTEVNPGGAVSAYQGLKMRKPGGLRWILAVDLNNNGWLDLVVSPNGSRTYILWGGPEGFSMKHHSELATCYGIAARAADFTGNGYPDLLIGGHTRGASNGELAPHEPHHSFVHVYWNGPEGLSESRKCVLRCDAGDTMAIADYNNDGWLDLFVGSYLGTEDRDINSFLYWNRNGMFHEFDRQELFTHAVSGCIGADFNEDGYVDLAVANHKVYGDHVGYSCVWWNGPKGFNPVDCTKLPTCGPHGMNTVEPGNILTRGPEEYYYSEPVIAPENLVLKGGNVTAELPPKTWVKLLVRTAPDAKSLAQQDWREPAGTAIAAGALLQYRLELGAKLSLRTPRVTKVELFY